MTSLPDSPTTETQSDRFAPAREALAAKRAAARLAQAAGQRREQDLGNSMTDRDRMSLQIQRRQLGGPVETIESLGQLLGAEVSTTGATSKIVHHTSASIRLYRPVPQGYYVPTAIPVDNVMRCLDAGYLEACPDCGTNTCGPDPNSCTGRAPIPYRTCPVAGCNEGRGKRVYDDPLMGRAEREATDSAEIVDDAFANTTPAQRTKAKLERHILLSHPQEASMHVINSPAPPNRGPVSGLDIINQQLRVS